MNNLRKFTTEADYQAAELNYPAVSWITATDNVHFDKSAPTVNDKVMMVSYGGVGEGTFTYFNCEASSSGDITSILFNDAEVNPITCEGDYVDAEQVHIAKYTLNGTSIGDWCSGDLGCGAASEPPNVDVLFPSQITEIAFNPTNIKNMVVEATTPPTNEMGTSGHESLEGIYVPDEAVNAYKSAWSNFVGYIHPISEYSGNLPIN